MCDTKHCQCVHASDRIIVEPDDQMPYFETVLRASVQLVLASLERGSRQHIDTLDILFDLSSPIYAFCRPENLDAHHKVLELRQELLLKWRQGNGATRRLMNADSWALKPWRSVDSAPPHTEEHQQLCDTRQTQVEMTARRYADELSWSLQGLLSCLRITRNERCVGRQRRDVLSYASGFKSMLTVLETVLEPDRQSESRTDKMRAILCETQRSTNSSRQALQEMQLALRKACFYRHKNDSSYSILDLSDPETPVASPLTSPHLSASLSGGKGIPDSQTDGEEAGGGEGGELGEGESGSLTSKDTALRSLKELQAQRDLVRAQHCATLAQGFSALARCVDQDRDSLLQLDRLEPRASIRVMNVLRRVIITEETRKLTIEKSIMEAEDCLRHYGNVRRAWQEAGREFSGMGEKAPAVTSQDLVAPVKAALEAYAFWKEKADLGRQAQDTDMCMERLKFQLMQAVPFLPHGTLSPEKMPTSTTEPATSQLVAQVQVLSTSMMPSESAALEAQWAGSDHAQKVEKMQVEVHNNRAGSVFGEAAATCVSGNQSKSRGRGDAWSVESHVAAAAKKAEPVNLAATAPSRSSLFVALTGNADPPLQGLSSEAAESQTDDCKVEGSILSPSLLSPRFGMSSEEVDQEESLSIWSPRARTNAEETESWSPRTPLKNEDGVANDQPFSLLPLSPLEISDAEADSKEPESETDEVAEVSEECAQNRTGLQVLIPPGGLDSQDNADPRGTFVATASNTQAGNGTAAQPSNTIMLPEPSFPAPSVSTAAVMLNVGEVSSGNLRLERASDSHGTQLKPLPGVKTQPDQAQDLGLWGALEAAGAAIDDEQVALKQDVLAFMPSGLILEAGRCVLERQEEDLRVLRSVYDMFDVLSPELESQLSSLPAAGDRIVERDAAVHSLGAAQETYEEAYEDLEEAVLKTQGKRAQRRGLDLEALRGDVAAKRAVVHAASKQVELAMVRLAKVSVDFPEISQHLRSGLPPELLEVWNPNRTLTFFNSHQVLVTDSRHRVYRALLGQAEHEEAFAVKEYMLDSEAAVITCMREAALLCRLRHPNIVQVVAVFEDPDPNRRAFFMQMPFYHYGHLETWIDGYAPCSTAIRTALADVLSALVYLHSLGIVHCDVKPPNILIASDERGRLADFDISVDLKTRVSVRYSKSKTTCVGYTPGFEAPELLTQGASAATDMFAFGQTLNSDLVRQGCLAVDCAASELREQEAFGSDADAPAPAAGLAGGGAQGMDTEDGRLLEAMVAALLSANPAKRPSAAQVLEMAFFVCASATSKEVARSCCITASDRCLESKVPYDQGIVCQCGHFTCKWCLVTHVRESVTCDLRVRETREGKVFCPFHPTSCSSPAFSDVQLASLLPKAVFDTYLHARMELLESQKRLEIEGEMQAKIALEVERLVAMEQQQRLVIQARRHIEEEILQTRCPRAGCRQAFYDFDGCFAVKCCRCPCAFCAWCLADCGEDAHAHVAVCPEKPAGADELFGTNQQYIEAWSRRTRPRLSAFLNTLDQTTLHSLLKEITPVLDDRLPGFIVKQPREANTNTPGKPPPGMRLPGLRPR